MIVTRFAPSPTGYLHLGHAFAAITARDAARGGMFRLRIEDLDVGRAREEFVQAIFEDLLWLGLDWREPVVRQSTRFDLYRAALAHLKAEDIVYPCFCTRAEISAEIAGAAEAPHGPDGPLYPGTCRRLSRAERAVLLNSGASHAFRLDSRKAAERLPLLWFEEAADASYTDYEKIPVEPLLSGDIVLARKDVPASYHLAVVIDDADQEITLVTRGRDLLPATHVQRVLQFLLDLPLPRYAHHRLITDESGCKLSKRTAAKSLRALRAEGVAPRDIRVRLSSP
ncbi:MAG TPA: tRNA glutamyl-Q(34) synthetase GluQRS [Rhizomicrobium sp.]|jgi:glutamyl-Q tRNA(Asp) synthetase|nr:tRNA glutamyl-Q(34) synthetase GluQRS [Rhizomicrobium sp.]